MKTLQIQLKLYIYNENSKSTSTMKTLQWNVKTLQSRYIQWQVKTLNESENSTMKTLCNENPMPLAAKTSKKLQQIKRWIFIAGNHCGNSIAYAWVCLVFEY